MQYLSIMNMLKSQTNLCEPIEYVIFAPILELATWLISYLVFLFNFALKISAISITHDDAEFSLLCLVNLSKSHNIGVLKHFQDLCLSQCFSSFFLRHCLYVNLFNNSQSFVWLAFDQISCSKWSNTECWYFFVGFVLLFFHFLY